FGSKEYIEISWKTPRHGWIALNSDGAVKQVAGKAGCGGVLTVGGLKDFQSIWETRQLTWRNFGDDLNVAAR
ncbi:hypothetical protein L195_g012261, partial [Trifolium pratense]